MTIGNNSVPLADRLRFGYLTVEEVCGLACCGRTQFYHDAKAGIVAVEKHGRFARVKGPDAAEYLKNLTLRTSRAQKAA